MRRSIVLVITLFAMLASAVPGAGAKGTVDFCRPERDGTFRLQKLGERALARVVDRVGGGAVGDVVPGMPGYVFDDECVPRLVVIAEAWSTTADGERVEIARLEDTDGDGAPSGGDRVRTSMYPLDLDGGAFGSFGTTTFVIADGSVSLAADGATEVRARSGCGDVDCWFFWAVLDNGSSGYERYAEFHLTKDGFPVDNTTLFDGRDAACDPAACSGVFAYDVMFLRPASPSGPSAPIFDSRVSPADDGFLEVAIGG